METEIERRISDGYIEKPVFRRRYLAHVGSVELVSVTIELSCYGQSLVIYVRTEVLASLRKEVAKRPRSTPELYYARSSGGPKNGYECFGILWRRKELPGLELLLRLCIIVKALEVLEIEVVKSSNAGVKVIHGLVLEFDSFGYGIEDFLVCLLALSLRYVLSQRFVPL